MIDLVRLLTMRGLAAGEHALEIHPRRQLRRIVRETKAAEVLRASPEVLAPLAIQGAADQEEGVRGALVVLEAPLAA